MSASLGSLPLQPAPLVGRAHEIETARRQLVDGEARLLTLTGPAGVGKTSLAIAVAAELAAAFPHGAWLVELAPLRDPDLVLSAIARALDVQAIGDQSVLDLLGQHLRARSLLLVLDNFEQVVPAAAQLAQLLAVAPELKLLVTSREPLHLRWERTLAVPPLPLPDLREQRSPTLLAAVPSIALFVQRAQAVNAEFALTPENAPAVAQICVRLDGLPLAIELAAARGNALTPREILARLLGVPDPLPTTPASPLLALRWSAHDLPARHQTLRAAIHWSYELLSPDEQLLLRHLAIFSGGFDLDAATAVAGERGTGKGESQSSPSLSPFPVPPSPEVEDLLFSLVDKNLVQATHQQAGGARFRLLEVVREYGLEQLTTAGESRAAQARRVAYFLAVAERAAPELRGPEQVSWLRRLETEHDNVRAALGWSIVEGGDPELGLRMAAALYRFWWRHGHPREGRDWLTRALEQAPPTSELARAKALNGAAVLSRELGDYTSARALFEESLVLFRRLQDSWGTANALTNLGSVAVFLGHRDEARALLAEALERWHEVGDPWGMAITLGNQSRLAQRQGEFAPARELHQQTLALFRQVGDPWGVARFSCSLGRVRFEQGEPQEAAALFLESAPLFRELGEQRGVAECLEGLASVAVAAAQARRAAALLGAAWAVRDLIQVPLTPHDLASHERDLNAARKALGNAEFAAAWDEGRAMSMDQAVDFVLEATGRESRGASDGPPRRASGLRLSRREAEVLPLLAEGLSNKQIARALIISEPTAKFHVGSILNKLGADTRAQAVALAAQQGLLGASS